MRRGTFVAAGGGPIERGQARSPVVGGVDVLGVVDAGSVGAGRGLEMGFVLAAYVGDSVEEERGRRIDRHEEGKAVDTAESEDDVVRPGSEAKVVAWSLVGKGVTERAGVIVNVAIVEVEEGWILECAFGFVTIGYDTSWLARLARRSD